MFSAARGAAPQGGEEGEKQRERAADVMNNVLDARHYGRNFVHVMVLLSKAGAVSSRASDAIDKSACADSYLSIYMLGQSVFMMVSLGMNVVHQCARLCEPRHADTVRYRHRW